MSHTNDGQEELPRFGPYLVSKTIGRGSFAKVKLAIHDSTKEQVALKVISKRGLGKTGETIAKAEKKIIREIGVLRELKHPNVVRLYDSVQTKNDVVLAMEFCPDGELFDHLTRKGRLRDGLLPCQRRRSS